MEMIFKLKLQRLAREVEGSSSLVWGNLFLTFNLGVSPLSTSGFVQLPVFGSEKHQDPLSYSSFPWPEIWFPTQTT